MKFGVRDFSPLTFRALGMPDETPHWQDYAAMVLILAAMSTVLLKPGKGAPI